MKKVKLIDKVATKKIDKECHFCGEDEYCVLDSHRIIPEEHGGKYYRNNVVTICACCHRKIHHSKRIVIDRWYNSTKGRVLHYWEDGEEKWK